MKTHRQTDGRHGGTLPGFAWAWLALVLAPVVFFAPSRSRAAETKQKTAKMELDAQVPDFELTAEDGKPVRLKGLFKGKTTVLAFWYHQNKASLDRLTELKKILDAPEFKGTRIVAVTKGTTAEERKEAAGVAKKTFGQPAYFDGEGLSMAKAFNVTRLPVFYILDGKGVVRSIPLYEVNEPVRGSLGFKDYLSAMVKNGKVPAIDFQRLEKENKFWTLVGKPAPDFEFKDLSGRPQGLKKLKGKKNAIVVFWMVTCPHCQKELPLLQKFYLKHRDALNFEILSVTIAEPSGPGSEDRIRDFVNKQSITFPTLLADRAMFEKYGVSSWPAMLVIDKAGRVTEPAVGELLDVEKMLKSALTEKMGKNEKK